MAQRAKERRKIRLTLILRYPYNGNAEFLIVNLIVEESSEMLDRQ